MKKRMKKLLAYVLALVMIIGTTYVGSIEASAEGELMDFTIKTETASKEYDGTPLTAGATAEGLAEGHTLQCTTTSITDAGKAVNEVLSWDIVDANGISVKELYAEPEVLNGYLEVTPRTVILVVDGEMVLRGYQEGVSHTFSDRDENGDYTFTVNILDDLYTEADYEYVGNVSVTTSEIGVHELAITEDMFVNKNSNFYITVSFMNKPSLQIAENMWSGGTWYYGYVIAGSATKEYDGTPLTCNTVRGMNGGSGELIEGVTAVMTPESTITNVGSVENVIKTYGGMPTYFDGIKKMNGTLTVIPRTGVTVTITPNSATVDYDGSEHTVSGYTVSIRDAGGLHDLYTEADFTFSGNASVTATEAGTYTMNLSADDFTNNNPNFENVEFVIAEGGVLTIEREKMDFSITTGSAIREYDGTPLTAEATAEGVLAGHTLQCTTTSITDAGTVSNAVVSWDIVDASGNSVKDQYNEPTIIEGTLTVTPLDVVVVNIIGNVLHSFADDSEQKVTGYTATFSTPLYTEADFEFTGDATAKGTEAGTYWMGLEPGQFKNISGNFTNVHFMVTDGYLEIDGVGGSHSGGADYAVLTIAGRNARKMYDGTPLTAGYVVSGLIKGDTLNVYMYDDAITDVGTAPNRVKNYTYRSYLGSQYGIKTIYAEVNQIDGILEVYPRTGVTVTITPNSDTVVWDGSDHTISGYTVSISDAGGLHDLYKESDFTFSGNASVTATEPGTYTMNLSADDFTNNNPNFADVEFVIADGGGLTIEEPPAIDDEIIVTIVGNSETVTYNGEEQSVSGYTVAGISDARYTVDDFTFTGTANAGGTNAGTYAMGLSADDFENTNRIFTNVKFVVQDGQVTVNPYEGEIVVTVTGNGVTYPYDGTEKTADGYTVEISNPLLAEDDIKFNGTASASGTDVGEYDMGIDASDFENLNKNFTNVTFEVVEGSDKLVIEQAGEVTVTITEKSGTYTYDGTEKTVSGYDVTINSDLYTEADFTFNGIASVSGTDAGTYDMEIKASDFVNNNTNFGKVTFVVVDGQLTVNPCTDKVVVKVTGNGATYPYDGTEKTADGYTVEISNPLLTEDDIKFNGDASASGTDAGEYDMGIDSEEFENLNKNFTNVIFEVVEGSDKLVIEQAGEVTVTITEKSGTYTYDGTEKTVTGYDVTVSNDLYTEADFAFNGTASVSGTDAGTYDMEIEVSDFVNNSTNFSKVTFVVEDGQLTVDPCTDEIVVTVTGNGATYTYDGTEKVAEGYTVASDNNLYAADADDFEFSGTAYAKGTNAGTYDMGIAAEDFTNINPNFTNIKFVVAEGSDKLVIEKVTGVVVKITENGGTPEYNGTEQTMEGYTVDITDSSGLYTEDDFTFSGDDTVKGTDAGDYSMELKPEDFTNNNPNFEVTFEVVDSKMTITPFAGEVVVTITENGKAVTFDGNQQEVEGYEVTSISNTLYTANDFIYTGDEADMVVTGTSVGTYEMNVDASKFENQNANFSNVRFEVVDSQLAIASPDEVIVYISGNTDTVEYNGEAQSVSGYTVTSISNPLYKETDFSFTGTASATATELGTVTMGLKAEDFVNTNANFDKVKFVVTDGQLTIAPNTQKITVTITANSDTVTYDGTEKTVSGYTVSTDNSLYTGDDFTFSGDDSAKGTDAGTYDMNLSAADFRNINEKFTNVEFVVAEGSGQLVINPVDGVTVTVKGNSDSVVYDGTTQKLSGYTTEISNALYTADDFTFSGVAEIEGKDAGTYVMDLDASQFLNTNNNFINVTFVVEDGRFTIDPVTDKVTVIITGDSGEHTYDGTEKEIGGYTITIDNPLYTEDDFTFGGDATAKGTDAGTYDMDWSEDDFTNISENFTNVEFVIEDNSGKLVINPVEGVTVIITENSGSLPFNGKEQTKETGYTVTSISNALYTENDFEFHGDTSVVGTNAGTYEINVNPEDFVNTNGNFKNVTFEIVQGQFVIDAMDELTVFVTENSASYTYDGTEKTVSGYTVSTTNDIAYGENDFTFNGTAEAKGTNAGTYEMQLKTEDFTNVNENFAKVNFVIVDGMLTVTPITDEITVVITGNSGSYDYDGTEKVIGGYTVTIDNPLFTEDGIKYNGNPTAKGTDAGTYDMALLPENFANTNDNFSNIKFVITEGSGQLVIKPVGGVTVTIKENSITYTFDGTQKSLSGYTVASISNPLYMTSDFSFNGKAEVTGTAVGTYNMEVKPEDFVNNSKNFTTVTFVVEDGRMVINPEITYRLTIHYVDEVGNALADDYVADYKVGTLFNVQSPHMEGYVPNYASISSSETGMPAVDVELTVEYTAVEDEEETEPEQEPEDPQSTQEPQVTQRPQATQEPSPDTEENTDKPERVQESVPEQSAEPVPEKQPTESVDVQIEVDENGDIKLVPIGEEDIPLADLGMEDGDHYCNIASLLIMLVAMMVLIAYTKRMKKQQAKLLELKAGKAQRNER